MVCGHFSDEIPTFVDPPDRNQPAFARSARSRLTHAMTDWAKFISLPTSVESYRRARELTGVSPVVSPEQIILSATNERLRALSRGLLFTKVLQRGFWRNERTDRL